MTKKMIGIIDIGISNGFSVANAFRYLNIKHVLIQENRGLSECSHLVLPGVGSYTAAMAILHEKDLVSPILHHAKAGKPLLGICLGMQLLTEFGDEGTGSVGLGLLKGRVSKMTLPEINLRLPHMGWNHLEVEKYSHLLPENEVKDATFYFAHSYVCLSLDEQDILARSHYGQSFVSAIAHDNILGVQFHPEKSQSAGLSLLERFVCSEHA